jgi:hypothetical protein
MAGRAHSRGALKNIDIHIHKKSDTLLDQKTTRTVNKEVSSVKLSVLVFILVGFFLQMSDNRRMSEVKKILVPTCCLFSEFFLLSGFLVDFFWLSGSHAEKGQKRDKKTTN